MSGVPNSYQKGPSSEHTNARHRELVNLTTRIDEIEKRLEEIESEANRHWFRLATYLTADMQHGNKKDEPKRIYICPCCHELVELMPKNLVITRVNAVGREKRAKKAASTTTIP